MSNIKENNRHNLKFKLNYDEFWDFQIDRDGYSYYNFKDTNSLYDKCLISNIDLCNQDCISGDSWIISDGNYQWESGVTTDDVLYDISYLGFDNGLFSFRKDRISNKEFVNLYKNSSYQLDADDYRLKLHAVSGCTLKYDYPLHIEKCQAKLNGGFFQGFFETRCDQYKVLPSEMKNGDVWDLEFELKRCDLEKKSDKTLNDSHPDNKGIFFYIGTRAENKWVYLYSKKDFDKCDDSDETDYLETSGLTDEKCFSNPMIVFEEDKPLDIDNYSNFEYYNEDIIDYENEKPIQTLDSWCCYEEPKKESYLFFRSCRCRSCGCIPYSKPLSNKSENDNEYIFGCSIFGEDGYISDYDGLEEEDSDYIEEELTISDFDFETENEFNLADANNEIVYKTKLKDINKFIVFDRTKTGYTVNNWDENDESIFVLSQKDDKFSRNYNLFTLMNRTPTGYTVDTIDELRNSVNSEYDMSKFYGDLYNNALAFIVKDDGSVGYRYLTIDCSLSGDDKTAIEEGFSLPRLVKPCEWTTIHVKINSALETMKMRFYVNGKLVYVTKDLPKLNLRKLNELDEKQEGVPFNISLGGGTQGLAETILPNYMEEHLHMFPLEKYFAGTFIGYIRSFRFYDCSMEYMNIFNNYQYNIGRNNFN